LRFEFSQAYATERVSMTELCDEYGISRKTGYKWVDRFEAGGRAGLADRSRRPHTSPRATDPALVARLCEARRRHPTWSARKLGGVAPARSRERLAGPLDRV
jgi:transposase-like protein